MATIDLEQEPAGLIRRPTAAERRPISEFAVVASPIDGKRWASPPASAGALLCAAAAVALLRRLPPPSTGDARC